MVERITLKNKVKGTSIIISKLDTPEYVLDDVNWGEVVGTHYSNKYVGQIGESVIGSTLGTRQIEITGWVLSEDGNEEIMKQRKNALNSFISPNQEMQVTYSGFILSFMPDKTIRYSTDDKDNHEYFCKFKIVGECFDPLFQDENNTIIYAASVQGNFIFPLAIHASSFVFGRRILRQFFNIKYDGVVDTGFLIRIKANGVVTNPRIIHRDTQVQFLINKTLAINEEILIDTNKGSRRVTGGFNGIMTNYFKYKDINSDWLQLVNGDNIFKVDADFGLADLDITMTFSNKYLEVQNVK